MTIERTKSEVIIRLSSRLKLKDLQEFVDYLAYKEATSQSSAQQTDIDKLAKEINKSWWSKNKVRFAE